MSVRPDSAAGDGETCLDHSHYLMCELCLTRHEPISTFPNNRPKLQFHPSLAWGINELIVFTKRTWVRGYMIMESPRAVRPLKNLSHQR